MSYLNFDFMHLFIMFLRDAESIHPEMFGLGSFGEAELLLHGFDRVGDVDDYCLYEKDYQAIYFRSSAALSLKCYFYKGEPQGLGISVAPGVRLITLLKHLFSQQPRDWRERLKFYFYEDEDEGAVIVDSVTVIRFGADTRRSAYHVRELESDQKEGGAAISVGTVIRTMVSYDFSVWDRRSSSLALSQLFELLNNIH